MLVGMCATWNQQTMHSNASGGRTINAAISALQIDARGPAARGAARAGTAGRFRLRQSVSKTTDL